MATLEEPVGSALGVGSSWCWELAEAGELWVDQRRELPRATAETPGRALPREVEPDQAADRGPDTETEEQDRREYDSRRDALVLTAILLPQLAWMGLVAYLALHFL